MLAALAAPAVLVTVLATARVADAATIGAPGVDEAGQGAPTLAAPLPAPLAVLSGFDPPSKPWLPGNRGVDLAANTGEPVFATAAGVVRYAGELAGRGVVSISHAGDLRTTYEPVDPLVRVGDSVVRGQLIGHVSNAADSCGPPGKCLHWGAIKAASYVDPMQLLDRRPTVRLLPLWRNGVPLPNEPIPAAVPPAQPAPVGVAPAVGGLDPSTANTTSASAHVPTSDRIRKRQPLRGMVAAGSGAAIAGVALAACISIGPSRHGGRVAPRARPLAKHRSTVT